MGSFQSIIQYLKSVGHDTTPFGNLGVSQGVARDPKSGRLHAAADYRKSGGVDGMDDDDAKRGC